MVRVMVPLLAITASLVLFLGSARAQASCVNEKFSTGSCKPALVNCIAPDLNGCANDLLACAQQVFQCSCPHHAGGFTDSCFNNVDQKIRDTAKSCFKEMSNCATYISNFAYSFQCCH